MEVFSKLKNWKHQPTEMRTERLCQSPLSTRLPEQLVDGVILAVLPERMDDFPQRAGLARKNLRFLAPGVP